MEPLAYEIGLRPWEFWRMTPAEFLATVHGYHAAEDRAWYRVAWQTAHLLNMVSKKTMTPEKLLGRRKARPDSSE